MRALVIGASGFVGLNVVDALLANGFTVRVSRRKQTATFLLRKRDVELVDCTLQDEASLRHAMTGCDVALLTGAHYPRYSLDLASTLETGVTGVRNACRAALATGLPHLVYTSTIATLDPAPPGRRADERDFAAERPQGSVYRAVKWEMEREVDAFTRRGLSATLLLAAGCLGPWDLRLGTGGILVALARGELPWWVDGWASLVDVADVAAAHVQAARTRAAGRFCLSGHDVRVAALLSMVAARWGGHVPGSPLAPDEARARSDAEERDAAARRARTAVPRELVDMALAGQPVSSARAARELGFAPRTLHETLDRAHAFYVRCRFLRRNECSITPNDAPV